MVWRETRPRRGAKPSGATTSISNGDDDGGDGVDD
jgi:hypothetical protein